MSQRQWSSGYEASQDERWRKDYFVRIQSTLLDTAPRVLDDLSAKQKRIILATDE